MNKLSDIQVNEIRELLKFIIKSPDKDIYRQQEFILSIISLITNDKFQARVKEFRGKYQIPIYCYTTRKDDDLYDEYLALHKKYKDAPEYPMHPYIKQLCDEFGFDIKKHGEFIIDYLYHGHIRPIAPLYYPWLEHHYTGSEYKYKADLIADHGGENKNVSEKPYAGYLRFYKDTTKNKLIKFIEENWDKIAKVQEELMEYPHHKHYGRFKRDIQVYILHLLGFTAPQIADRIVEDNVIQDENREPTTLDDLYYIEDTTIRQIIVDVGSKINALQSVSKT